ncbi:MAG: SGNH/GDSL hydrolase family protein [Bryobacteraceae bacterium]
MRVHLILGALLLGSSFTPAFGASIDQIVAFGDSLSDTGNLSIATLGQFPGDNYAEGRFTNGPNTTPATSGPFGLWVDQLAAKLGVPDPQPFLALSGGSDYAFATARTGSNGMNYITDQVNTYLLTHPTGASSTALYTIWGGSNDLFNGSATGKAAADALYANIQTLAGAGAKNFLWLDVPPLGNTPLGATDAAALNAQALAFKNEWTADIALLEGQGISVTGVDIFNLFNALAANPSAYGFTNITTPAQGLAGVNPNNYLFWDIEHPTTAGHDQIATTAYNALVGTPTAVPEPVSAEMIAFGIISLAAAARIRKGRSSAGLPRPQRS